MKPGKTLILTIPQPCPENWSAMTLQDAGRYCAQCKKCVVDFTGWTDAALYKFFSKNTDDVCGRFYAYQLEKKILPPPPSQRNWYRMACGLGLSLLLAGAPAQAHFMVKPSLEQLYQRITNEAETTNDSDSLASFRGIVLDEKAETVIGAIVRLSGDKVFTAITDQAGHFSINPIPPGVYDVRIMYNGYKTMTDMLLFQKDSAQEKTYSLELDSAESAITYTGYAVPLVNVPAPRKILKFGDEDCKTDDKSLKKDGKNFIQRLFRKRK